MLIACQSQNKNSGKTKNDVKAFQSDAVIDKSDDNKQKERMQCNKEVCLQLRNHDPLKKSFEIYILNSVSVAGFQCDFQGITIASSDRGLLKENEYQTSNSAFRILSFSMQAKLIPVGEGVLTEIFYSDPTDDICMTGIIFAGIGGKQLTNNEPDCMKLN